MSPWRWRLELRCGWTAVRIGVALAAFFFVACMAGEGRVSDPAGLHARAGDEGERSAWLVLIGILALACVSGTARITIARDVVVMSLASILVETVARHAAFAHDCGLVAPFGLLLAAVVVHVAADLVMLRPVFAALRAPLPRAIARRRR